MKKESLNFLLALTLSAISFEVFADTPVVSMPTISIDASKVKAEVSPMLYGLMTEEINFSYEGGLYGELIRNRSFKAEAGISYLNEEPIYWSTLGDAEIALDKKVKLNDALDLSLLVNVKNASENHPAGISNPGYWGIAVKPKTSYSVSFYAKTDSDIGPIGVSFAKNNGSKITSASVNGVSAEWKKFEVELTTGELVSSKDNIFTLTTTKSGKIWLQQVSVFGKTYNNRVNGNRPDLMKMLADMKPTFLRLPGGNYLEGDSFPQRFDWKKTIGDTAKRPGHRSPWNYWSTDGMGLLEFLLWCEDLKVEPLLAVFAGYALQGEHVSSPEELAVHVQDALDEIEYVTGDVNTTWGAQRAKDGHPAPFPLRYVEVGNEDNFDKSNTYDKRFSVFYKAIKSKYPHLQIISTMSAESTPSQRPDVVDDHTYAWGEAMMYEHMNDYDNRSRSEPKVFVGEWATHDGWPMPTMKAAIADAAYLTGLERNSDVVIMSAYAPLLANLSKVRGNSRDNSMQWAINMIGYDALNTYGTPSYYVQKMFAENLGDVVLESTGSAIPQWTINNKSFPSLYWVSTRKNKSGHMQIKLVNRALTEQPIHIVLEGVKSIASSGTLTVLSTNDPDAGNSLQNPNNIAPKTIKYSGVARNFDITIPALSVSVLDVAVK